ncbi:MAG: alcohol dehydrogenase catalytic domain-containing protein [Chloroflexi bacterium]|nr:alcohol dehydrogenase catalytic domain-containing protein [Chloroflexota bacterium]
MRALVFDGERLRYRTDYPRPELPPGEALVRVRMAGICGTDLEITRGYMGFRGVPGHEFVGVVEEAPDAAWVGRRVVGEINAACGECPTCRAGRPTHCPNRTTLGIDRRDGAFAEFLCLPLTNLHPVPDHVPDEAAVFTEPLAAALQILEQVHVRPTDRVAVLGAGRLGQLIARVLRLTGCELVVWGRHEGKLDRLRALGIEARGDSVYPEAWADVVVEVTGSPTGFAAARRMVRPRGTLVLKSTYRGSLEADFTGLVVDEITLVGSRCGPFPPALRLLASGLVPVADLVEACYPLEEGEAAFEHAARPGVLKVLVQG